MTTSPFGFPGVQSLERAFLLLEAVADAGGSARLTELAASTGFPLPTIHRIVRSLVAGGYLRQKQTCPRTSVSAPPDAPAGRLAQATG